MWQLQEIIQVIDVFLLQAVIGEGHNLGGACDIRAKLDVIPLLIVFLPIRHVKIDLRGFCRKNLMLGKSTNSS